MCVFELCDVDVSENSGTPKSSILKGFSILNHPFWDTLIFGFTHVNSQKVGDFKPGCFVLKQVVEVPQTVVQEVIRHVGFAKPWGKISEVVEKNQKPDGKSAVFF